MKRFLSLFFIISIMLSSASALNAAVTTFPGNAWHWTSYTGSTISFWLKSYGLWQNGQPVNRFTPSVSNANPNEMMFLRKNNSGYYLTWALTADGTFRYRCRPDGNILYLTGKAKGSDNTNYAPYNGWIKIIEVKGALILTLDNNNTYRYFEVMDVRN